MSEESVRIPSAFIAAIVAQAEAGLPDEVCGILGGVGDRVERIVPLTNTAASPEFYEADPEEQLAAYTSLYDAGLESLGVYHSHPASPARPSVADIELAHDPDAIYAIVSLQDRSASDFRAYRVRDGVVREIRIETTED